MTQNELFLRFVTRRVSVARIKGRVDWATARGPQILRGPGMLTAFSNQTAFEGDAWMAKRQQTKLKRTNKRTVRVFVLLDDIFPAFNSAR